MSAAIPLVGYLVLDEGDPHLVANQCDRCGARFFERHNGCARCGGRQFSRVRAADRGTLISYTIVHRGALRGPFVAGVFELDDASVVKANLVGVDPDPGQIELGGKVRLTTFPVATDSDGTQAVAFGFIPI